MDRNVLIVFFSRSGTTRQAARELRRVLELRGVHAKLEELRERRSRRGILGYLRSGFDAARDRPAKILPLVEDPARYDLVVIGTPVWGGSPATPVCAFLRDHARRMRRTAFFLTHGGSGREKTFSKLRQLAAQAPVAELAVRERDVAHRRYDRALRTFAEDVAYEVLGAEAPPGVNFGDRAEL